MRQSRSAGLAVAALAVAAITALIFPLKQISTPESNGVLYLLAVLLVATLWGFRLGLFTALLSAAAFNYFHLPPVHRFTIADSGQWVALLTFLVAAVVASGVAELARSRAQQAEQRRREAVVAAELARILLGGASVQAALPEAAAALGLPPGAIGPDGTVAGDVSPAAAASLAALLAVATERERLQAEVVETRGAAAQRRAQDGAAAHGLARPAHAADGDHHRRRRAGGGRAVARGPPGARAGRSSRSRSGSPAWWRSCSTSRGSRPARPSRGPTGSRSRRSCARRSSALDPGGERFALSIDADLPLIRADAAQLERAFANLMENAARYSGREPVSVRARVVGERLRDPGGRSWARDPPARADADLRGLLPAPGRAAHRLGAGAGHRQGVHRGQRRPGVGRVAARPGDELRRRAAARAAPSVRDPPRERVAPPTSDRPAHPGLRRRARTSCAR